jgi:hypothetical protein
MNGDLQGKLNRAVRELQQLKYPGVIDEQGWAQTVVCVYVSCSSQTKLLNTPRMGRSPLCLVLRQTGCAKATL